MDIEDFWPNCLSDLERMRSWAYSLERHVTKGPWSLESWLEGEVGKRPSEEKGHSLQCKEPV